MAIIAPALALLLLSVSAPGMAASSVPAPAGAATTATRAEGGATTIVTISARILHASAAVGDGRPAPDALMIARPTMISAADGSPYPALVYDFE